MASFLQQDLGADSGSDEDDGDFVPAPSPPPKARAGSPDAEAGAIRKATEEQEALERKRRAAEAFAAMQAEAEAPSSCKRPLDDVSDHADDMVEVKRARRFAGQTIYETVRLKADDPEAVAFLAKQAQVSDSPPELRQSPALDPSGKGAEAKASLPTPPPEPLQAPPKPKPPIRRKPRQSLEAMSAALDKGKKMTTLEKSQMDWKSHMSSDSKIQDELDANRRSGGYLQKRDFLDRVDERRSGTFGEHLNKRR